MKKRIILTVCSLMLAVLLAGCDKNEYEADMRHDSPVAEQEKEQIASSISEVALEPALYEKMPEWDDFYKEYENYYNAIQIEDMFFYTGMLGADVVKVVENSADKEIIAVSGDKLVEADEDEYLFLFKNETQKITYYRGEEPWFDVYVQNYSGSLLPYSECLVSLVLPREAAIEYCRMIDGSYTSASMKEIKYMEYEDFATKLQKLGYSVTQKENKWTITNESEHSLASVMQNGEVKNIYWTWQEMDTVLEINLDTGLVEDVSLSTDGDSSYGVYGTEIPKDFDWKDETFKNSVVAHFMQEDFYELYKFENIELVSLFEGHNAGHLMAVFRGNNVSDGEITYIGCTDRNVGIDVKNGMTNLTHSIDEGIYITNKTEKTSYVEVLNVV